MRLLRTRRYLAELAAMGDYLAERNPRAAYRIVNDIDGAAQRMLMVNPFIGRTGDIPGTREFVVSGIPYIVAYRVADDQIELLFVQHGAQVWPSST
jgi:plasmid stabilization system protein ParE